MTNGSTEPGGQLCLSCGLCCEGILYEKAKLLDDETERMPSLGLRVRMEADGAVLLQPCACWHGQCSIYQERPRVCRQYQCKVLRRFHAGDLSREEGLRRIQQARSLVENLRQRLPDEARGNNLWYELQVLAEAESPDTALLLDMATLRAFCRRHFEPQPQVQSS